MMTRDEARDALAKEIAAVPNANIVETLIRIVLDGRTRNSELVEGIKEANLLLILLRTEADLKKGCFPATLARYRNWLRGVGGESMRESLLPPDPATDPTP